MGLFRQRLSDLRNLVVKKKYTQAKAVLDAHINAEHQFSSDLAGLQGAIGVYQHQLRNLQGWWSLSENAPKTTQKAIPEFHRMITETENQLKSVEAILQKMLREAKFDLK